MFGVVIHVCASCSDEAAGAGKGVCVLAAPAVTVGLGVQPLSCKPG